MQTLNLIQTNHGVSYPLVGPQRIQQTELVDEEDDPAPAPAVDSKPRVDRMAAISPPKDKNSPRR